MPKNKDRLRPFIGKALPLFLLCLLFSALLSALLQRPPYLFLCAAAAELAACLIKRRGGLSCAFSLSLSAFAEYLGYGDALFFLLFFLLLALRLRMAAGEEQPLLFALRGLSAAEPLLRIFLLFRRLLVQ